MNTSRYFKLGLFVLIGAGLLAGVVLALGAGRLLEKRIPAETVMDESVNGLEVGSPVKYRGVTIGRVTSIAFAADKQGGVQPQQGGIARYVLVEMTLESKSFKGMNLDEIETTLRRWAQDGLRARLAQPMLGGGGYIELDFLPSNATPPPQIARESNVLYIPSAPSPMNQVMSAAEQLAGDLRRANLPQVVRHIDALVMKAADTAGRVNKLVEGNRDDIKAAVSDLPAITGGLKNAFARANEILHDKRLDRTLGNVADDSASAGETLADLRTTTQELRALISTRQEDIQRIIADLRRASDNLAALSTDARDNPSRLLFGGPPPRKEPGQ